MSPASEADLATAVSAALETVIDERGEGAMTDAQCSGVEDADRFDFWKWSLLYDVS